MTESSPSKFDHLENSTLMLAVAEECSHEVLKAIIKCVNFAAIKHKDQRRKDRSATPYINHPIGVAHILTQEANVCDLTVIQAALLHDTIEDTDCTFEEIELHFGTKVMDIVKEVTDDKRLPRDVRKQMQIDSAQSSTREAKLVKLADKLHNLRDLEKSNPRGWTDERVQAYFVFAKKVCNGLRGVNLALDKLLDQIFEKRLIMDIDDNK